MERKISIFKSTRVGWVRLFDMDPDDFIVIPRKGEKVYIDGPDGKSISGEIEQVNHIVDSTKSVVELLIVVP